MGAALNLEFPFLFFERSLTIFIMQKFDGFKGVFEEDLFLLNKGLVDWVGILLITIRAEEKNFLQIQVGYNQDVPKPL